MLGWSILRFLFKLFDIVCGNGPHFGGTTMLLSSAFGAGACYSWLLIAITLFAQGILKPASPDFFRGCALALKDFVVPAFDTLSQTSTSSKTSLVVSGNCAVFYGVSLLVLWRFNGLKTRL